ncbi:unnamed protein product, partial [Mesorhabditis belari]|uniref:Uncharacterized protein n=1 Tax=Mesorhabditis belari TaxID=2138241 RepID=A0AAF3EJJ8_9BILA
MTLVPHIRLTDPDGDSCDETVADRSPYQQRTGPLAKQKSLSCEVLHAAALASTEMVEQNGGPSTSSSSYVNIPRTTLPTLRNILVAQSWESDIPSASSGPSPISSLSTPRPSHESDCDATDNEGPPEIRFREQIESSQAGPSDVYDVLSEYKAENRDELDLRHGSVVRLITRKTGEIDWYFGEADGKKGLFPVNYVKHIGKEAPTIKANEIEELNEIGQGAFARVLKANYWKDGKRLVVALKKPKSITDKRVIEDMKREAVMLQRLCHPERHPNVVELYGICLEAPHEGLLLELCEGDTLASVYKTFSNVAVSARVLVDWGVQIAAAMKHLVEHQYVHRDLKADNVLVKERVCMCALSPTTPSTPTSSGADEFGHCRNCRGYTLDHLTLKITDFGLTREAGDKRQSVAGTEAWMAPEAYKLKEYGEASDVWSFGVVLWELLTKSIPYEGIQGIVVAYNVAERKLNLPVRPEWPQTLQAILKTCWDYEPTQRPSFIMLHQQLTEFKAMLTKEEEEQVQRVRTNILDDLENFYNDLSMEANVEKNPEHMEQFKKVYERMIGNLTHTREEKPAPMIAPQRTTLRRKEKKKQYGKTGKIDKKDIGRPQDFKHCIHVKQRTNSSSPTSSKHGLQVIYNDEPLELSSSIFGTLPRKMTDASKKAAQQNFYGILSANHETLSAQHSISSPNLNGVNQELFSPTTLSNDLHRVNAIKKKRNVEGFGIDGEFDTRLAIIGTPMKTPASKVKDKRSSQDSNSSTFFANLKHKVFGFARRHSRQDSEDKASIDGDEPHRSPRSPSESSQHSPDPRIFGNLSRGPASTTWISGKNGGGVRPRGVSTNEDDLNRVREQGTKGRGIFQPSNRTTHYLKNTVTMAQSSPIVPGKVRPSTGMKSSSPGSQLGIDDAVPTTPPQECETRFPSSKITQIHQYHITGVSPNGYEKLSKNESKLIGWNLDEKIPADGQTATTSFDMAPPAIGFRLPTQTVTTTPYTTISHYSSQLMGAAQPLNAHRASMSPLAQTPPAFPAPPPPSSFSSSSVDKAPVYISNQMYQRIDAPPTIIPRHERPATLDLPVTPGESGISTAGSSLTSAPLEYAPPPPPRPTTVPVDL